MNFDEFKVEEQPGGGFNFGVINKKSNALDDISLNKSIVKIVIPTYEILYKEETGYGVYECEDEHGEDLKITGVFLKPLTLGQTYEVNGKVVVYRGEKQISSETIKNIKPVNERGMISYLRTLKGLEFIAEEIFEIFGMDVIDVLMADPMKVAKEIKGIGKKTVLSWQEELNKLKDDQQTLTILLKYGLTLKQARTIFEVHKEGVVYKIEQNPYFLSDELYGFGFAKCDKIAKQLGYDPKGMFRIQEGIMHVLKESSYEGHCYLPTSELIKQAKKLLNIPLTITETKKLLEKHKGKTSFIYKFEEFEYEVNYADLKNAYKAYYAEQNPYNRDEKRFNIVDISAEEILKELDNLAQVNKIIYEDNKVYLPYLYEAENIVAERIVSLSKYANSNFAHAKEDLDNLLKERNIVLEEKQREAVLEFSKGEGGFFILNGSAGCGKTFTLNIILEVIEMQYKREGKWCSIKVYAPTGKASKVASKATNRECMTVHRGLKYNPTTGFEHNINNPLDADVIVVDESSMLDIQLAKHLLCAIMDGTKVIFLGDTKQLPSVGAGNILHDMISSGVVKVVTLNVVKRQGKESGIIRNANKIINAEMISSCKDTKDAYVVRKNTPFDAQKAILKSIRQLMDGMNFSLEDIQVLCPQKTSLIGTDVMNYLIQQEFNPDDSGLRVLNKRISITNPETNKTERVNLYFKKGDKVIHTKNNYNMPWYVKHNLFGYQEAFEIVGITNGECGVIEDIVKEEYFDSHKTKIIVRYEDKYVFYEDVFDELEHAYALTIHKSQGSQWQAVIIPIMRQNYNMLDNNLFYTGYTRAQKFCVVIGQEEAIRHAVKTFRTRQRYTGLQEKIKVFAK